MTKKINKSSSIISLIFMILSMIFFVTVAILCLIVFTPNYSYKGNKIALVSTDLMSSFIPKDTYVIYSTETANVEIGQLILFNYEEKTYIQEVKSININDGQKIFTAKDSKTTLQIGDEKVFGVYEKSLPTFSKVCQIAGKCFTYIFYIVLPVFLAIGIMLIVLEVIEKKKKMKLLSPTPFGSLPPRPTKPPIKKPQDK